MNIPSRYPGSEGFKWKGFKVDILMKNGRKYCNVPFKDVVTIVDPNTGSVEYLWVIDDYSSWPPTEMRLDSEQVSEISQAGGSICRTTNWPPTPSTWPPMPPTNWPPLPPNCTRRYNPYTGQFEVVCY